MRVVTIILFSISILSCRGVKSDDPYSKIWNSVVLETDGQKVTINYDQETIVLESWGYRDSLTNEGTVWIPKNVRNDNAKLTPVER
jgi:hypothetical protein